MITKEEIIEILNNHSRYVYRDCDDKVVHKYNFNEIANEILSKLHQHDVIGSACDCEDYKNLITNMENVIIYKTSDGESFTDRLEADKHEFELYLRKLQIINRRSWFDAGLRWFVLGIFIVGYLLGWFCNYTSA